MQECYHKHMYMHMFMYVLSVKAWIALNYLLPINACGY